MTAKKQRAKSQRKASKLAEEAWSAADDQNLDLAVKIIRRAVELNPANPMLWHDQGTLLALLGQDDQAAASFEAAIQIAPDFAGAFAALAAIRARQGKPDQAVTLQREAVRHDPRAERYQGTLAAYEALLAAGSRSGAPNESQGQSQYGESRCEPAPRDGFSDLASRIAALDWTELDRQLTERGLAHVPGLLHDVECETLRRMFHEDRRFAKSVTMKKQRFGKGVYRYFASPIPAFVEAIRRSVYPHVAEIANDWQRMLHRNEQFPATWPEFRSRCAAAGQTVPSPLMLRYEAGGFNAPHQDLRGDVFFPLQLVIVLSPRSDSGASDPHAFTGGEFLFCNQPERKPADRRAIPAGLGDAILFCTRERLVQVGGAYGLQPVKHGMEQIASGTRYAVGIPFHEFE